jgi:hypothetical protein
VPTQRHEEPASRPDGEWCREAGFGLGIGRCRVPALRPYSDKAFIILEQQDVGPGVVSIILKPLGRATSGAGRQDEYLVKVSEGAGSQPFVFFLSGDAFSVSKPQANRRLQLCLFFNQLPPQTRDGDFYVIFCQPVYFL